MTSTSTEFAVESNKTSDVSDRRDAQPQHDALSLLMDRQNTNQVIDIHSSAALPELTLAASREPFTAPERDPNPERNPNLSMLGNPSDAKTDPKSANNYLIAWSQYVTSYNNETMTPNWVSWQLNTDWLGPTKRDGKTFHPDETLPEGFNQAVTADYAKTGFDRGHHLPSADRTKDDPDNDATFLMTNIGPQIPDNNRGPWEALEKFSRKLANEGKELYIIDGTSGSLGHLDTGENIGETWWKVAVVMPQPGMTPADVTPSTDVIAVEMPNVKGQIEKTQDWHEFISTVGDIEKHRDAACNAKPELACPPLHILGNLPPSVAAALAQKKYDKTDE